MKIFDSSKKEKVEFIPINDKEVRIYVCGPTVYDYPHLGHARSALSFDLLRRVLSELGFHVIFSRNITDVDDKIIKKAREANEDINKINSFYEKIYNQEMSLIGVEKPDIEPHATKNIDEMISFIEHLLQNNVAYQMQNGDIYFDTSKDKFYGQLSNMTQEDKQHRVCAYGKKNENDFVLWKICDSDEKFCFDSPFGKGRPGWHIECSAMINKYLAYKDKEYQIDIHGGGADLFFPHHENEAAQTRCAFNQNLAKYWMHNGFVKINNEKMSKSLGNSFFLKDALKFYHPEVLRFYLLSTHYRSDFNFNEKDLLSAKKRLDKLYRLKKRIYGITSGNLDKDFKDALLDALSDDLNISKALSIIDEMISFVNEELDKNEKNRNLKKTAMANIKYIEKLLGFAKEDAYEYFQFGVDEALKSKIKSLIAKRLEAKKAKDFSTADKIREEILLLGVKIMDTPNNTLWESI